MPRPKKKRKTAFAAFFLAMLMPLIAKADTIYLGSSTTAQTTGFGAQTASQLYGLDPNGNFRQVNVDLLGNLKTTGGGGAASSVSVVGTANVSPTAQNLFYLRTDAYYNGLSLSQTGAVVIVGGPNGFANNAALTPLYVLPVSPAANTSLGNYNTEGTKQSYYASVTGVAISALTDFFTITGSGSKTIRVTKIRLSGIATAASAANVTALIRSTADTAGTSFTATDVAADSSNAAGTAVVKAYTASPTLGTLVGFVDSVYQTFTTSAGAIPNVPLEMAYGTRNAQSAVLRGTTQQLCLSLNGATVTGLTVNVAVEWTEE